MTDLCTANPAYDTVDCENLAFAIRMAKFDLGKSLQERGMLTEITYVNSDRLHPEYAGELAAAKLNLGQADLAKARKADIERWCNAYQNGLPLIVRLNAAIADVKLARQNAKAV